MAIDYDTIRDNEQQKPLLPVARGHAADDAGEANGNDHPDGWSLDPETLVGNDTVVIVPPQIGEFTCTECFLVKSRSQFDHDAPAGPVCRDCAVES